MSLSKKEALELLNNIKAGLIKTSESQSQMCKELVPVDLNDILRIDKAIENIEVLMERIDENMNANEYTDKENLILIIKQRGNK